MAHGILGGGIMARSKLENWAYHLNAYDLNGLLLSFQKTIKYSALSWGRGGVCLQLLFNSLYNNIAYC